MHAALAKKQAVLQDLRAWHASLDDSVNPEAHSLAGKLLSYLQLPHD